jgi:hypothetical protein
MAGNGISTKVEGDELVIRVNLKGDEGISQTGKSRIVATSGYQKIPYGEGFFMTLTVGQKIAKQG